MLLQPFEGDAAALLKATDDYLRWYLFNTLPRGRPLGAQARLGVVPAEQAHR